MYTRKRQRGFTRRHKRRHKRIQRRSRNKTRSRTMRRQSRRRYKTRSQRKRKQTRTQKKSRHRRIQKAGAGDTGELQSLVGAQIVSASQDGMVKIWNAAKGKCVRTFEGHSSLVFSAGFSPDGTHIVSGSEDKTVKIWSVATGQCIQTIYTRDKVLHLDYCIDPIPSLLKRIHLLSLLTESGVSHDQCQAIFRVK